MAWQRAAQAGWGGALRRSALAALLSLALPGLGQLHRGRLRSAAAFFLAAYTLPLLPLAVPGLYRSFTALVAWAALAAAVRLAAAADAARGAWRARSSPPRLRYRWALYALLLALSLGLSAGLRRLLPLRMHWIPTIAMEPAVARGERIAVDRLAYRNAPPARGDIVTYRDPGDLDRQRLSRVIALGGETVELRLGFVWIDGERLADPRRGDTGPWRDWSAFGPLTVPEGSLFLLSDHRSAARDSRTVGAVGEDLITGKALYIYGSPDRRRLGRRLDDGLPEVAAATPPAVPPGEGA